MRARGAREASHLLGLFAAHPPFWQKETEADDLSVQTRESSVHSSARAIDQDRGSGWSPAHARRRSSPPGRRSSHPASKHDVSSVLSSSASVSVVPRRLQQGTRPGLLGLGRGKFGRQFIVDQSSSPKPGTPTSDTTPTPTISRGMALRVLKRMPRGESPLPAVPRAVTDCDRIKVDRQTARQQAEGSDEGGPERIASSPLRMALIQLPLGRLSRRRGGARQEHGQADCPAARPRSQGSTKWTLAAHHHAVSPIASPVAHAGTAALQQPWREQEEKSCPPPRQPARASRRKTSPSPDCQGGSNLQGPHGALPFSAVTFGLGSGRGGGGLLWSGRWAKPVRDI